MTRHDIFVNIINKIINAKAFNQQVRNMQGMNKAATSTSRTFKKLEGTMEKSTKVTAGLDRKGKQFVRTQETLVDKTGQIAKKQEAEQTRFAAAMDKAKVANEKFDKATQKTQMRRDQLAIRQRQTAHRMEQSAKRQALIAKKQATHFKAEYLSLMFFGMAIQRVFTRIIRWGVDAFKKITDSAGFFASSINRLGAYWTYLKFTIGHALETVLKPLMPTIISVINAISKWIQKNPKLTTQLIFFGAILGSIMMLIGILVLGFSGLRTAFINLGIVAVGASGAKGLGALVAGFGTVLVWVVVIIIVLALLKRAYQTNFLGIRDTVDESSEHIKGALEGLSTFMSGVLTLDLPTMWEGFLVASGSAALAFARIWHNTIFGIEKAIQRAFSHLPGFLGGIPAERLKETEQAQKEFNERMDQAQKNLEKTIAPRLSDWWEVPEIKAPEYAPGAKVSAEKIAAQQQSVLKEAGKRAKARGLEGEEGRIPRDIIREVESEWGSFLDYKTDENDAIQETVEALTGAEGVVDSAKKMVDQFTGEGGLGESVGQIVSSLVGKDQLSDSIGETADKINEEVNPTLTEMENNASWAADMLDYAGDEAEKFGNRLANLKFPSGGGGGEEESQAQFGAKVYRTGKRLVHAGEEIIPSHRAGKGGDINITINGNVDDTVYRKLVNEIRRYVSNPKLGR